MSNFRYIPYHELGDSPNIIVDGSPNEHTRLTLSHWPGSTTPERLQADLSAEIVFNFLEAGGIGPEGVEAVSNNHFDEDGLISLFSIIKPEYAFSMKDTLIDIARAGDFSTFRDRDAARVSFVLSAWTNPDRSPLNRTVFGGSSDELTMVLYQELIDRLPRIIERIDYFEEFWKADDHCLELSEDAINSPLVSLEHDQELDLTIVSLPDEGILGENGMAADPASWVSSVCHPMAIHNATEASRILVMQKRRYELYFRYETWVNFVSRKLPARVDLKPFTDQLKAKDGKGAGWRFNGVDAIISRLYMTGNESRFSPNQFQAMIREALSATPVA